MQAVVENPDVPRSALAGFVEAGGYVSIKAEHYARAGGGAGITWRRLPDIGRDSSGMEPFPVTAPRQTPGGNGPRLEYPVTLFTTGSLSITAHLSPRNGALPGGSLAYAISIDDEPPQVVDIIAATGARDATMNRQWERNTSDNVNATTTLHRVDRPGPHVVRFWMVDPTVVLHKLVLDIGGLRPSYLGPPESLLARPQR